MSSGGRSDRGADIFFKKSSGICCSTNQDRWSTGCANPSSPSVPQAIFMVWQDDAFGNREIYYKKASIWADCQRQKLTEHPNRPRSGHHRDSSAIFMCLGDYASGTAEIYHRQSTTAAAPGQPSKAHLEFRAIPHIRRSRPTRPAMCTLSGRITRGTSRFIIKNILSREAR
jgi:hypothetical protein